MTRNILLWDDRPCRRAHTALRIVQNTSPKPALVIQIAFSRIRPTITRDENRPSRNRKQRLTKSRIRHKLQPRPINQPICSVNAVSGSRLGASPLCGRYRFGRTARRMTSPSSCVSIWALSRARPCTTPCTAWPTSALFGEFNPPDRPPVTRTTWEITTTSSAVSAVVRSTSTARSATRRA